MGVRKSGHLETNVSGRGGQCDASGNMQWHMQSARKSGAHGSRPSGSADQTDPPGLTRHTPSPGRSIHCSPEPHRACQSKRQSDAHESSVSQSLITSPSQEDREKELQELRGVKLPKVHLSTLSTLRESCKPDDVWVAHDLHDVSLTLNQTEGLTAEPRLLNALDGHKSPTWDMCGCKNLSKLSLPTLALNDIIPQAIQVISIEH